MSNAHEGIPLHEQESGQGGAKKTHEYGAKLNTRPTIEQIKAMSPAELKINFQRNMLGALDYASDAALEEGYMLTTLREEFNQRYSKIPEERLRSDWENQLQQMIAEIKVLKETNHFVSRPDNYILPSLRQTS